MPFLTYTCFLFFLVLQACNLGDAPSTKEPGSDSLPARLETAGDTVGLHRVADDRTAGRNRLSSFTYRDSTGAVYLLNPNWSILQRKPRTAKEADLPGTNGLTQTWTDGSGQVETRIYECVSPTALVFQSGIGCQVEPGFVLVGGGAWADYGTGIGAFITESRPLDANLTTWVASSKAHVRDCAHYLHTYAIGMRLKDNSGNYIPRSLLTGTYMKLVVDQSPSAAHSQYMWQYSAYWPDLWGYPFVSLILGGGARANWTCCGAFLTTVGAGPSVTDPMKYSWAKSKDHYVTDLHTTTLYTIAFKPNTIDPAQRWSAPIPNFGNLEMKGRFVDGSPVNTGVAFAILDADPGYVMTSLGAETRWTSGIGRLLIGVKPTGAYSGQEIVYSKDHKVVSAGISAAFFTEVRKAP